MKTSTERLAAFSDAVIAIIITIIVLEIPLPEEINPTAIKEFLTSIGVYFISFMLVGAQWNKHHTLFQNFKEGSPQVFWRNILYLFFLSLVPIFTKWIMENPKEVAPAFGYSLVYIMTIFSFHFVQIRLIKDNPDNDVSILFRKSRKERAKKRGFGTNDELYFTVYMIIRVSVLVVLMIFSYLNPEFGILFFVVFPLCSSLYNMWRDSSENIIDMK